MISKAHSDTLYLQVMKTVTLEKIKTVPVSGSNNNNNNSKSYFPQRNKSAGTKPRDSSLGNGTKDNTSVREEKTFFCSPGIMGCEKKLEVSSIFLCTLLPLARRFRTIWKDLFERSVLYHRGSLCASLSQAFVNEQSYHLSHTGCKERFGVGFTVHSGSVFSWF